METSRISNRRNYLSEILDNKIAIIGLLATVCHLLFFSFKIPLSKDYTEMGSNDLRHLQAYTEEYKST